MGKVNVKSLLPNKSLFNSVVVHRSLHDSNLQIQETLLFNRLNFPFIIYPWKAICDERNEDILPKAVVILALSDLSFKPPFSNGLDDLMRCYAFDGNHKTLDYVSRVYIFMKAWFFKGIVAVCPFDRKQNCPSYVSLYTLENSKVKTTNMLKVEKQPNDHGSVLDILRHFGDQFESFYLPFLSLSLSLSLSLLSSKEGINPMCKNMDISITMYHADVFFGIGGIENHYIYKASFSFWIDYKKNR